MQKSRSRSEPSCHLSLQHGCVGRSSVDTWTVDPVGPAKWSQQSNRLDVIHGTLGCHHVERKFHGSLVLKAGSESFRADSVHAHHLPRTEHHVSVRPGTGECPEETERTLQRTFGGDSSS